MTNSSLINVSEERTDAFDGGDEGGAGGYVDDFLVGRIGVGGRDRRVEDWAFLDAGGWSKGQSMLLESIVRVLFGKAGSFRL